MVLERPLELLQMMRQSEVVRIQECNQLCVGKLDPAIASRRNAAVTLLERVQFPAISPCPIMYPLERPVAGAIINDDDLFRAARLPGDAVQRVTYEGLGIVSGDNHGNAAGFHQYFISISSAANSRGQ